ncbi:MAG: hypothetical protein LC676_19795, partial [Loktanella sp.]|nr:hypothetical protein [Loktanella sp.]
SRPSESDFDEFSQAIKDDWNYAASFYPDLIELYDSLNKIDRNLGFLFQAYLVENKCYQKRVIIAVQFKRNYLRENFGDDENIQDLAFESITSEQRDFAHDLNIALKKLGTSDIRTILKKLSEKYPTFSYRSYRKFGFGNLISQKPQQAAKKQWENEHKARRPPSFTPGQPEHKSSYDKYPMVVKLLFWLVIGFILLAIWGEFR